MNNDPSEALVNAIEIDDTNGSINHGISETHIKEEENLRRKLKFFYMNPIEKWQYKQRFPYKFIVQLIKIVVVTLQSCLFAYHRSFYIDYVANSRVTFSHLFLLGWDPSREVIAYPPQTGDLALYKTSDFYSAIDYAVVNYANIDEAVGSYFYTGIDNQMAPLEFCIKRYKVCELYGFNETYIFNDNIITKCINITVDKKSAQNFSSEAYLRQNNASIHFPSLVQAKLTFGVKTVNLKPPGPKALPDCYLFNLSIIFDNQDHDGKMKLSLDSGIFRLTCAGEVKYESDTHLESLLHSLINSVVIIFCLISFILCLRAVLRAQTLRQKAVNFFLKYHNKKLSFTEKLEFVNTWYLTMILSDALTIIGSGLKEQIEQNQFDGDEWNICSVMLGTGTFLIWFCVLRYLGFFKTYNVVVFTLKVAAPMIFRYMICTMLIYAGFTFCGWLVLGPYHNKFQTISVTSECLFALINGDDIFGTFSTLQPTNSVLMWYFSRIYLYFFLSLFIYVILSLFVSVILDAYESVKRYYVEGMPKNFIQEFTEGGFCENLFCESSSSLAEDFPTGFCESFQNFFSQLFGKVTSGRRSRGETNS